MKNEAEIKITHEALALLFEKLGWLPEGAEVKVVIPESSSNSVLVVFRHESMPETLEGAPRHRHYPQDWSTSILTKAVLK